MGAECDDVPLDTPDHFPDLEELNVALGKDDPDVDDSSSDSSLEIDEYSAAVADADMELDLDRQAKR
eukprot:10504059-Karenia_brevis.AAC.1